MKLLVCSFAGRGVEVEVLADSSLTLPGRPTFLPDLPEVDSWKVVPMVAVRVSRLGKGVAGKFVSRYHDAVTVACRLLPFGADGELMKGIASVIDYGLTLGNWVPAASEASVRLQCGKAAVEWAAESEAVRASIVELSRLATLKIGDVILLPFPGAEAMEATVGTKITAKADDAEILTLRIL